EAAPRPAAVAGDHLRRRPVPVIEPRFLPARRLFPAHPPARIGEDDERIPLGEVDLQAGDQAGGGLLHPRPPGLPHHPHGRLPPPPASASSPGGLPAATSANTRPVCQSAAEPIRSPFRNAVNRSSTEIRSTAPVTVFPSGTWNTRRKNRDATGASFAGSPS